MLSEREYPDQTSGCRRWSITAWLTVIFITVFAFQCINDVYFRTPAEGWLALTLYGIRHGWAWQILSFQFLHSGLFHLVFNLIAFWWLGHFCEGLLGPRRYLLALFGSGCVGGLLQGALMLLFPLYYGMAVVGASAGVSGLLAIFALLERDSEVRYNFLLPIRAIWLLYITGGISLFFTLVPTAREYGVAHAAHLGGLLAGVAWVKLGWHREFQELPGTGALQRLRLWFARKTAPRPPISPRWQKLEWEVKSTTPPSAPAPDEFMAREVDPILEKIAAHGLKSLTDRERKILEQARERMAKR